MGNLKVFLSNPEGLSEFRSNYNIPLDVQICALLPGESLDEGSQKAIHFPTIAIMECGIRFLLDPLLIHFLSFANLFPLQCAPNLFRIVMGVAALSKLLGISLGVFDILSCYYLIPLNRKKKFSTRNPKI